MDIREKIAREDFNRFNEVFMDGSIPNQCYRFADRILAINVEEDEDCTCNLQTIEHAMGCVFDPTIESFRQCPKCNGTGKKPAKTLQQLIDNSQI